MKFITSTFINQIDLISHKIAIIRATNYNTPKLNVKKINLSLLKVTLYL